MLLGSGSPEGCKIAAGHRKAGGREAGGVGRIYIRAEVRVLQVDLHT